MSENTGSVITQCPANVNVNTGPGRTTCDSPASWEAATATDNCPGTVAIKYYTSYGIAGQTEVSSGATFPKATTTVTTEASDAAGNKTICTFTVTVSDNTVPVITHCPANVNVNTGPGRTTCDAPASWEAATATDNCPGTVGIKYFTSYGVTGQAQVNSGDVFPEGVSTVTAEAKDVVGNISTCTFTVTVSDNTVPVITHCPANVNVNTGPGRTKIGRASCRERV